MKRSVFQKGLLHLARMNISKMIPDKLYLPLLYYGSLGKHLNLKQPLLFNEKLQWLKLHDRKRIYNQMVDKYEVKQFIASNIGEEYIIPTLGLYHDFDSIDFSVLPKKFVIKCTHDSGGVVICKDKEKLNMENARKKINDSLRKNYYWIGREWPYKNITPRIIIEKYMDDGGKELEDYKFHCFNGKVKMILVCRDRFKSSGLTEDFFSENWEHMDIHRYNHSNATVTLEAPQKLDEMVSLAERLSTNIPFVRVDFYSIHGQVYFGEMTFFPASGIEGFYPEKYDRILGDWLKLPLKQI